MKSKNPSRQLLFPLFIYLLAAGASLLHPPNALGQSSLDLRGSLQFELLPAEAALAGAAWRVDDGAFLASGAVATGLAPGYHQVSFFRPAGWSEPEPREVVVVGGKLQTLQAEYQAIPVFYFEAIPAQTARHGKTLRFGVHSLDPLSPANGKSLTMSVDSQPVGPITFDPVQGEVAYTPDLEDRTDFTMTFRAVTAAGTIEGKVLVSPLPNLAPEDTAIIFRNDQIDPLSDDYVQVRVEVGTTPKLFNHIQRVTRKVSISGAALILEANSTIMGLYDSFNGNDDIEELTIFADQITIRSPLRLPQTTVKIHARELRFEGNGQIDVTQAAFPSLPIPSDGADGARGPDLSILVERFHSAASPLKRFISRGRDGRNARPGSNGANLHPSLETCGTHLGKTIAYERCTNTATAEVEHICGQRTIRGGDAVAAGKPGEGGNGGTIFSTLNLAAFADLAPGVAGQVGANTVGGTPTGFISKAWAGPRLDPCSSFTTSAMTGTKGRDATAPSALRPQGSVGQIQVTTDPGAWLHPISVQSHLHYLKDLYLANEPVMVRRELAEYATYIQFLKADLAAGDEKTLFSQLASEIETLLARIDSHLDYFGNPLTWVPMLSFEANYTAFEAEIESAIPVLYLSYWIESAATHARNTSSALGVAREKLNEEIDAALDAYEAAQAALPGLQLQAADMQVEERRLITNLRELEAELVRRAEENVEERHRVPFWRKAIGVLGAIAKVVPVAQPALAYVGVGLSLISKFDSDNPTAGLEGLPDLLKAVKETPYTACLKEKKDEADKAPTSDRAKRIARLQACASVLAAGAKSLREVFKSTAVASAEVMAELEKLRAQEPMLQKITLDLEVLALNKQLLGEKIAANLSVIANTSTLITEKLLAIDKINQNLASVLAVLDHQALLYVSNMERQARERLLKYQYLMAKAYQYRTLKPYTGSFKLAELFEELQALVELPDSDHRLDAQQFESLMAIYSAELDRIADDILTDKNQNAPARTATVSFRLSAEEIRRLNETNELALNLGERSLFGAAQENLRIVSLQTKKLSVKTSGPVGGTASLRLDFVHSGQSRIQSGGHGYLFTHYRSELANPIRWGTVYDGISEDMTATSVSAAEESLLRVLLGLTAADSDSVLFYSRPGALAEIVVSKEVITDNGIAMNVEELVLELTYDYSEGSRLQNDLNIKVSDGLLPLIVVSAPDMDQRTDGRGSFRRGYQGTLPVRLRAPATHGVWKFERWETIGSGAGEGGGGAILGTDQLLDITLRTDTTIRAVYGSNTIPPGTTFRRGDANLDGKVNISDPTTTLAFLFTGGSPLGCSDAGDTNDDGRLDISDAVTTLNFLFTGGAEIPAPGPTACGLDPTNDALECTAPGLCR